MYLYTWIYEDSTGQAPEILPYVSLVLVRFFFLAFSFDSKSIRRKHTSWVISRHLQNKNSFLLPPTSLPTCFANLAPLFISLSLEHLLTAQQFHFKFGTHPELRTKNFCSYHRLLQEYPHMDDLGLLVNKVG